MSDTRRLRSLACYRRHRPEDAAFKLAFKCDVAPARPILCFVQGLTAEDECFEVGADFLRQLFGGFAFAGDFLRAAAIRCMICSCTVSGGTGIGKPEMSSAPIFHIPTAVLALD